MVHEIKGRPMDGLCSYEWGISQLNMGEFQREQHKEVRAWKTTNLAKILAWAGLWSSEWDYTYA